MGASAVNGTCGSVNGSTTLTSAPITDLCSAGTATTVADESGTGIGPWAWSCEGSGGGSSAQCSASSAQDSINGTCGSAENAHVNAQPTGTALCSTGTAEDIIDESGAGKGPWFWVCNGGSAGSDQSCQTYVPPSTGGGCGNVASPPPAVTAGFTTLAGCWDFTSPAMANTSTWLDCAGASNPQWFEDSIGDGTAAPCSEVQIVFDAVANSNVLDLMATPAAGAVNNSLTTYLEPAVSTNASSEPGFLYPGTNSYTEITYRVDPAQESNYSTPGGGIYLDPFWSAAPQNAANGDAQFNDALEIDFLEIWNNGPAATYGPSYGTVAVTGGEIDWTGDRAIGAGGPSNWPVPIDGNYHTVGTLNTSSGSGAIGFCAYVDGTGVSSCKNVTPLNLNDYFQQSYLIMWNDAGYFTAPTGNIDLYIKSVRVWTCANWTNTPGVIDPATTMNSCSSPTVYTGTPP
jgi:hypothetical protein